MAKTKPNFAETILELEKTYGVGSVMGNVGFTTEYDSFSTGSIAFDNALGNHGYIFGRMYELMGWEGAGKTTLCGHAIANAQKKYPNKKAVFIDAEHALDLAYFQKLGVDLDGLYLVQPSCGEEGFSIAEKLIKSGEVSILIIDSDTSMKPKREVEGEIGDNAIGLKARLNSQAYPKLHTLIHQNNTCMIVNSQYREKIGVMFGNPTTTSGGHALKFYADTRIEVSKTLAKDGDDVYGNETKIKVTKCKTSPPYRKATFDIVFGEGIDTIKEILTYAVEFDIIKKSGSWYAYEDSKLGQGEKAVKQLLLDNSGLYDEVKLKVLEKLAQPEVVQP